jgi:hypothetical protein
METATHTSTSELLAALLIALEALEQVSSEMTVGDRFSNAGQSVLDALDPVRDAIKHATKVN